MRRRRSFGNGVWCSGYCSGKAGNSITRLATLMSGHDVCWGSAPVAAATKGLPLPNNAQISSSSARLPRCSGVGARSTFLGGSPPNKKAKSFQAADRSFRKRYGAGGRLRVHQAGRMLGM